MSDDYSDEQPTKSGIDSPGNTHFYPSDASSEKRAKYERLWFYNENLKRDRNNFQSEEIRRREKFHILDAISSSLDLPDYQHKEAEQVLEDTNFTDEVNGQYLSLETYCFAVCVFIHNQYSSVSNHHLPSKPESKNPEHYVDIQGEVGIPDTKLEQALEELECAVIDNV